MATLLQRKLIKLISENIRSSKRLTLGELMLKAGYSKSQSLNPNHIFEQPGMQIQMNPIVTALETQRKRAIAMLSKKISKAKYRDLVDGIDKFTKNIELLSGRATERHGSLTEEEKEKIDRMTGNFIEK